MFIKGYLHLTWEENYKQFKIYKNDSLFKTRGPRRVASHYAGESAGWFWSVLRPQLGFEPNKISAQNGKNAVTDVTYAVNGGYNGLDNRIRLYDIVENIIK